MFEADALTGYLVVCEHIKKKKDPQGQIDSCKSQADPFFPIFCTMFVHVNSCLVKSSKSNVLILAATLLPYLWSSYFDWKFGKKSEELKIFCNFLGTEFTERKAKLGSGIHKNNDPNASNKGVEDGNDGLCAHKKKSTKKPKNKICGYCKGSDWPGGHIKKYPNLAVEGM